MTPRETQPYHDKYEIWVPVKSGSHRESSLRPIMKTE